jgi:hypothetical protein
LSNFEPISRIKDHDSLLQFKPDEVKKMVEDFVKYFEMNENFYS